MLRFFLGHNPTLATLEAEWAKMTPIGEEQATQQQYMQWFRSPEKAAFSQLGPRAREKKPGEVSHDQSQELYEQIARSSSTMSSGWNMPLKRSSIANRPRWNHKLGTGPNPGHINDTQPAGERQYFSKTQSLPELKAFWEAHPETFSAQLKRMSEPEAPPVQVMNYPSSLS